MFAGRYFLHRSPIATAKKARPMDQTIKCCRRPSVKTWGIDDNAVHCEVVTQQWLEGFASINFAFISQFTQLTTKQ
jgi:hypothetical protein